MKAQELDVDAASCAKSESASVMMCRWYGWWRPGRRGRGVGLEGRSRQQRLLRGRSQRTAGQALQVVQQKLGLVGMARLGRRLPVRPCRGMMKERGGKGIGQGSEVQGIWTPAAGILA